MTVDTGTSTAANTVTIPRQQSGPAGPSAVACSRSVDTGSAPATDATAAINAPQTAG